MTSGIGSTTSNIPLSYTLPGYRFRRLVGEDSIGLWFDAEQESLGRKVTIRVLRPRFEGNPAARTSFLAEADRLVRLTSPDLVRALDVMRGDTLAVVTERVDRHTLEHALEPGRPLGEQRSAAYARSVARGLLHLLENGLALKNLTPGLIQIVDGTRCRLVPFRNLLTLREFALMKGKLSQDPQYVAPEQLVGRHPIGPKTPAYQVTALFWHMLTGRAPFPGDRAPAIARAHVKGPFPSLKRLQPFLSANVYEFIARGTKRDPERRPSLTDLAAEFDAIAERRPNPKPSRRKRRRRR